MKFEDATKVYLRRLDVRFDLYEKADEVAEGLRAVDVDEALIGEITTLVDLYHSVEDPVGMRTTVYKKTEVAVWVKSVDGGDEAFYFMLDDEGVVRVFYAEEKEGG